MRSRLTPLLKLFYNPSQAMIEISAEAPYITGAILAVIATSAYYELLSGLIANTRGFSVNRTQGLAAPIVVFIYSSMRGVLSHLTPVLFLIFIFVPACLLATSLIHRRASFTVLLRQDYAALTSCALYSWAASHLMMLIPALFLFRPDVRSGTAIEATIIETALRLVPLPYFVFLIVIAAHAVLRVGYGSALGIVALGSLSLVAMPLLPRLSFILTSPFLLIVVIILIRNVLGDIMSTQRARENFQRNLTAATLNPADASAHYNLGLIYQQRGQLEEAKASFTKAVEIDPDEIDAHYQLGRIARGEGRLDVAITHFDAVVRHNSDHSLSEVWREIGHAYFDAAQYQDAREAFERFIEKRPSDAEGRYRYGLTLERLGRMEEAASEMRMCIEAVRTSPTYKYRAEKHWAREAQNYLNAHGQQSV